MSKMEKELAKKLADLPLEKRLKLFQQLEKQSLKQEIDDAAITRCERNAENTYPLSFSQQRLWFLDNFEPGTPTYNIPSAYRWQGVLNIHILQDAFTAVVARHESLRTTFKTVDGEGVQVIAPPFLVELPMIDLRDRPADVREDEGLRLATKDAQSPFDLSTGPLLRIAVFCLDDADYILYLNIHHIISDGWTTGVMIREVSAIYNAFLQNLPSPLPELPIQYVDYAVWQKNLLTDAMLEKHLNYWKKQLAHPPVLELYTDRPRPATRTPYGTMQTVSFPAELMSRVYALAKEEGMTPFMVLLAAFKALLHHYTRQNDLAVGTIIANRDRRELEDLTGFFANTLALRSDLSGNPTFRQLLQRERKVVLEAFSHQDIPFEKLVEDLQPVRDLSRTPFFQVMLILQNTPSQNVTFGDIQIQPIGVDSRTSKFDLTLYLTEMEQGLLASMEYSTDLFDATTITRMMSHYQILLESVTANPETELDVLSPLPAAERRKVVDEWNNTVKAVSATNLPALFEAQVRARPEAGAVAFDGEELSYAALNERVNCLAHYLLKLGVGTEVLVGIYVERSLEMLVGLLGILKAGGTYVPLDPTYPTERLEYMIADARPHVILTQARLKESLPQGASIIICLDADWETIAQESAENPDVLMDGENLAYMIYTSGSTGKPKGVQLPHRALVNFLVSMHDLLAVTADDVLLSVTTISFDIAGLELYLPLSTGGKIVIANQETVKDGLLLSQALIESDATLMQATPATWRLMLDAGWQGKANLRVLCGGEALQEDVARELVGRAKELWNMYGPTETTIWSTIGPVKALPVTLGRPIGNTCIYILDPYGKPVPIGVPGEVHIGGQGLARGYRGRPDLSAERFVPDGLSGEAGARLYRTGDLGRYYPDGRLEFLERIDTQVKVRGYRIELGEIEVALREQPGVKEAVVVTWRERPEDEARLVAYVVMEEALDGSVKELRSGLKMRLPAYMLPSVFVFLKELPLTPNGKIDRRALPAPAKERSTRDAPYAAPRTDVEEKLVAIWAEVLKLERVGINDNFFELGGDSMLVMRAVTKSKQLGMEITPKQMFQLQTVAELADAEGKVKIIAEQGLVTGPVILSPFQHYFLKIMRPVDLQFYTMTPIITADEALDPEFTRQILHALLLHHDALRMHFTGEAPDWQLSIAPPAETLPFRQVQLPPSSDAERWDAFHQVFMELTKDLDIMHGPLIQAALIQFDGEEINHLMIAGHYMPLDIHSLILLMEDFSLAYEQLKRGDVIRLPAKSTSFQQWTQRLDEYAQSDEMLQESSFWLKEPNVPPAKLPVDSTDGRNDNQHFNTFWTELPPKDTLNLMRIAKIVPGLLPNDLAVAGIVETFSNWTNSPSVLLDLLANGREPLFEDMDLSHTIGWLSTIYPVCLQIDLHRPLRNRVQEIREQLHTIPKNGIGYNLLRYYRKDEIREKLTARPRPEFYFNFVGPATPQMSKLHLGNFIGGFFHDTTAERSHLIQITASMGIPNDGALHVAWAYNSIFHHPETIEKQANLYIETLKQILSEYFHED